MDERLGVSASGGLHLCGLDERLGVSASVWVG